MAGTVFSFVIDECSICCLIFEYVTQLAMHNLNYYLQSLNDPSSGASDLALNREINFIESDIDLAATLDPFTHIYMYDLGFPPPLQQSIANKFNTSVHARYFISYRPPRRVIDEYGYDVEFITQMNTSMFGSGENHTAYFYKRTEASINATNARLLAMTGGVEAGKPKGTRRKVLTEETSEDQDKYGLKVTLPATTRFGKEVPAEEVHCDRIFLHAVQLVAHKEPRVLNDYVYDIVQDHMNSPRGKRERRPSTKLTFWWDMFSRIVLEGISNPNQNLNFVFANLDSMRRVLSLHST